MGIQLTKEEVQGLVEREIERRTRRRKWGDTMGTIAGMLILFVLIKYCGLWGMINNVTGAFYRQTTYDPANATQLDQ